MFCKIEVSPTIFAIFDDDTIKVVMWTDMSLLSMPVRTHSFAASRNLEQRLNYYSVIVEL